MSDSKTAFSTVAFSSYENARSLIAEETFLIETYLDRTGKTLEAGTGGGRIVLELKSMGFSSLHAFDYVPGLIEVAKKKDLSGCISFEVQDATCLTYQDSSFDQLLYLAQIISTIEEENGRLQALQEAHRILKPGGRALFSFLSFDARRKSTLYGAYLSYLSLLRTLLRSEKGAQYLPWLKPGGRFNFGALTDAGPHFYWYRVKEVADLLADIGFRIVAIGSSYQVAHRTMNESYESCLNAVIDGMLYCVVTK
jgi:SAM-dependent methyltransferase